LLLKLFYLFALSFAFLVFAFSANEASAQSGIEGKVTDASNGEVMPFTTVALLTMPDSSLSAGAITDVEGNFKIAQSPGNYLLRISFVGYTDFYRKVKIESGSITTLKNLRIAPNAKLLREFEVEALQSSFRSDVDKRVFNVENSIVAEGGTAIDVLETLPSIQVDEEGGIRMRGSSEVLIYINGRPTNLSADEAENVLASFPANAVKSVELITNPSSRYDAAGAGGIINIILRKSERTGFNGQANASVGTRHKYNTGVNLNYGAGATNYYASYNFRYEERFSNNETERESFSLNSSRFLDQEYYTLRTTRGHVARFGIDHTFSERSSLDWYGQIDFQNAFRNRDYEQVLRSANGALDSLIMRSIYETNLRSNYESGLNYRLEIDTTGTIFSASASYAYDKRDRLEVFTQDVTYGDDVDRPQRSELQNYARPRSNHLLQVQADFEKPFAEKYKLEAGWKSTYSRENRPQVLDIYDFETAQFINDPFVSNEVDFERSIHAVYGIFRGAWGRLGYQAGLRAEYTGDEIFDENSQNVVTNNYIDLFPSAYLTYSLTENADLLLNYSRRINRPSLWALAPLLNIQDPLNPRIGNPSLQPEYTDSYELGMSQSFKGYFFTTTLFHRRTSDLLSRIFVASGDNAALMTWDNINTELATGLEVINQFEFGNWMDATLTGNFFYNEVQGGAQNPDFDNSNFTWTLTLLTNMKVGKIGTAQVLGNYRGPIVRPQGMVEPLYGINVGFRREVLKGKGTLSINVTDIFNTRRFIVEIEDQNFSQRRVFDWETRIATLAFTYRFGGINDKKSENGRSNGEMGGEDGF
jgi:iron complex outermembrane recepter protein